MGDETEILGAGKYLRLVRRGGWEHVEQNLGEGAVAVLAVTDAAEVVLIEQVRPPLGGPVIELPAGIVGD
ncbi:MAG: DNA mismatch repair protein MutT, partial [Verrucomicrobiales bacterium]